MKYQIEMINVLQCQKIGVPILYSGGESQQQQLNRLYYTIITIEKNNASTKTRKRDRCNNGNEVHERTERNGNERMRE
jgi:hypothetical protein